MCDDTIHYNNRVNFSREHNVISLQSEQNFFYGLIIVTDSSFVLKNLNEQRQLCAGDLQHFWRLQPYTHAANRTPRRHTHNTTYYILCINYYNFDDTHVYILFARAHVQYYTCYCYDVNSYPL